MATSMSSDDVLVRQTYRDFIDGCHILHYHRVLDAYGHLSVRHPHHPDRFMMSRYIAPGTISNERDIVEYFVKDAEPVDPSSPKGYSERCIHSEIMKRFPEVNAVIHSHSEAVVPYSISGVPLQPCFHMAGFLGSKTPNYDIAKHYHADDRKDMLVRNIHLGGALAEHFGEEGKAPSHAVVLMRGHGFTTQGSSIMDVVLRAIYTQQNASIQTTALTTRAAHFGASIHTAEGPGVQYLYEDEIDGTADMTRWSAARPWRLWLREVEAAGIYVNMA